MKIFLSLFLSICFLFTAHAQTNIFPSSGNVGIGTIDPLKSLDVSGDVILRNYQNVSGGGSSIFFTPYGSDYIHSPKIRSYLDFAAGEASRTRLILGSYWNGNHEELTLFGGKVGINNLNPNSQLDINGGIAINSGLTNISNRPQLNISSLSGEIRAYSSNGSAYDDGLLRLSAGAGTNTNVMSFIDLTGYSTVGDMDRNIVLGTSGIERLRVNSSGNVGIGTINPAYKLDVIGTIRSREVKVDMNGADFVFEDKYPLMPLNELENYIKTEKHLPEIASAKEMETDGVELGKLNSKLLQKTEELTLYLIEQNKKMELMEKTQNEKNKKFEEEINFLKSKIK